MPCRWRPRRAKVSRPTETTIQSEQGYGFLLRLIGLDFIGESPGWTLPELKEATLRMFFNEETGWMSEARLTPKSAPVYRYWSEEDAKKLMSAEPPQNLLARALRPPEYIAE